LGPGFGGSPGECHVDRFDDDGAQLVQAKLAEAAQDVVRPSRQHVAGKGVTVRVSCAAGLHNEVEDARVGREECDRGLGEVNGTHHADMDHVHAGTSRNAGASSTWSGHLQ